MPLTQHCSNILYNEGFDTAYDFTASFTYTFDTGGFTPAANYGYCVFFIDGLTNGVTGGGCNQGLGVIATNGSSKIDDMFLALGFDFTGQFTANGSVPVFNTGTPSPQPNSICLRVSATTTDLQYISSFVLNDNTIFYPLGDGPAPWNTQTIRIGVRNSFKNIDVYQLVDTVYQKLVTFNTNLSGLPSSAKFGISYSGDTLFQVKNITLNYT